MKLGSLDLPTDVCRSVGGVLSLLGDKWSVLVIVMLEEGSLRFSELKRGIGTVSQKMLTATLRGLERDGYLRRTVTPSIPPRVDYELTRMGRDALPPLKTMAQWALEHREQVEASRRAYDARDGAA